MASSAGAVRRIARIAGPVLVPALAYGAYKADLALQLRRFLTGPGKWSRLFALAVLVFNWKSLPFAWTFRVIGGMIQHFLLKRPHAHTPDKLFHPVVSSTHTSLMEVDYNIHKSNSTYFADLDVSRTHLVAHLLARGCHLAANNVRFKLVLDPSSSSDPATQKPARGKFGVMLGAVSCSFKREIKPFVKYEMWSRVLAWDRKWMYIITHFVEKGFAKPGKPLPEGWEKKVHATAISKYVFKIGRLTVHPAVLIGASGLLPERPGGWVSTAAEESGTASASSTGGGTTTPEVLANGAAEATEGTQGEAKPAEPVADAAEVSGSSGEWDWRRTEAELQKGLQYARQFAALDDLHGDFRGGEEGMLGRFSLG
ncbi:capsule polysaccharide biosynthesis protein [Microdochium bolleyi]|uniref:Capsule polysaccharide biosynthesis protein n=1 Tax=Microdochium bolleyi TaxID=196109 RepID=A0A136ISI9_9PEZI|nr:capsule polysaccharide biosynthesis protein [Microdochium bolleyi]